MDYEKKYKEALEWARKVIQGKVGFILDEVLEKFPELKESEDERIKRVIRGWIYTRPSSFFDNGISKEEILAWLEKQGQQKSADKIEPKFKVGDWCIDNEDGIIFQIVKVLDNTYTYRTNEGREYSCTHYSLENDARLWTIQDANAGDVLEFGDHGRLIVGIVSYVNKTTGKVDVNCLLENNNFKVGNYYNLDTIKPHPATKEQRDTLMKAMADSGWEFDFDKKELKKIEQKSATMSLDEAIEHCKEKSCGNNACALEHKQLEKWLNELKELKEQKLAWWSEEDEVSLNQAIYVCHQNGYTAVENWLKDLKNRVHIQPQSQWKPSKEQIIALRWVLNNIPYDSHKEEISGLLDQIKDL